MKLIIAFFDAIAAFPSVMASFKTLIDWFAEQIKQAEKRKKEIEMAEALSKAQNTHNTSGVDQIFDPRKKEPEKNSESKEGKR